MALLVEATLLDYFQIQASMWQVLGISLSWLEDYLMLMRDCQSWFMNLLLLALKSSLLLSIYTLRIQTKDRSQLLSQMRLLSQDYVSEYFCYRSSRLAWSTGSRKGDILAMSWKMSVFYMKTFFQSWKETSFSLTFYRMESIRISAYFKRSIIPLQSWRDYLRQTNCIFTQNCPKAISKFHPSVCLSASSMASLASISCDSASSNLSKLWPASEYFLVMSISLMISSLSDSTDSKNLAPLTVCLMVFLSVSRNIICSNAFAGSPFNINAYDFFIMRSMISSCLFWLLAYKILAQQQSTLFWVWLLLRKTCPRSFRLSFSPMSSLQVQQARRSLRLSSSGLPLLRMLKMVPYLRVKYSKPSLLSFPITLKMFRVLKRISFYQQREMSTRFTKPQSFSRTGDVGSTASSKMISRMRLWFLSLANFWATDQSKVVDTKPWISMQLPMQDYRYFPYESERSAPLYSLRFLRDCEQGYCCLQIFLMAWNILLKGSPMIQNSYVVLAMRRVLLRQRQKKESSVQNLSISRSLKGQVRQYFMCSLSFGVVYIFSHCSMKRFLEVYMSTLFLWRLARQQMLLRQVIRSALSLIFSFMKLGNRTFSSFYDSLTIFTFYMSYPTECTISSQLSSTLLILQLNLLFLTCRTTAMFFYVTTFTMMHFGSPMISQKYSITDSSIATLH